MLPRIARYFKRWGRVHKSKKDELDLTRLPAHIAIITDGNGRWAERQGLSRIVGHAAGLNRVRETIRSACDLGIGALTYYAFSTENWKRPEVEVNHIMKLPIELLKSDLPLFQERNIKVNLLGSMDRVPEATRIALEHFMGETFNNTGMKVNFAFNYGARDEIVTCMRSLAVLVQEKALSIGEIDESYINNNLATAGIPDPDLVIRTGGELRLSNFLLWQVAYSELLFTDVLWPDFDTENLYEAIQSFQLRTRRYGDV